MKIGVLSRNPALYSTKRLVAAAASHGHQTMVIDTAAVAVHLGVGSFAPPTISRLPALDAVIPRIGASFTFYGLAVVRQFEAQGLALTATADAIGRSRDKLHSLQLMSGHGLPIPRTAVIAGPQALDAAIDVIGGLPAVVKLIRGTQGRGVLLVRSRQAMLAMLERLQALNRQALLQEYIAEARGRDVRLIVVGGRCIAAMERQAKPGEFRANLHLGGHARAIMPDDATAQLAIDAAAAHGLAVAGVDLIPSARGPLLIEVNSSPGLEGIEKTTGIDVAGAIIAYLEGAHQGPRLRS